MMATKILLNAHNKYQNLRHRPYSKRKEHRTPLDLVKNSWSIYLCPNHRVIPLRNSTTEINK